MSQLSKAVSIHPYFKINEGRVNDFKSLMAEFIESTQTEKTCLYYDFSLNGDVAFCREAYVDAGALLAHIENVSAHLEVSGEMSDMIRVEVHGPAEELAKLKEPLAELPVEYFVRVTGAQF